MNTSIPEEVHADSWAKDFTPTNSTRRTLLYLQCGGSFSASTTYKTVRTSPLASYLCLFTKSGEGRLHYQGEDFALTAGTLMVVDCRFPHTYQTAKENWQFDWLHFSGTAAEGYTERLSIHPFPTKDEVCLQAFQQAFQHLENYTPLTELAASGSLVRLCLALAEQKKAPVTKTAPLVLPIIADILAFIEEHCLTSLSLEDIAKKATLDKYKLGHLFKEQVGCSPHEYLLSCRMNRAKTLLRTTDNTISSVAEQCGFDSASYFVAFFKDREGITPLAYRKQFAELGLHTVRELTFPGRL